MNANSAANKEPRVRLARAVPALAFVTGAVALLMLRPLPDAATVSTTAPTDFLHTPAADLSVPRAEHVFASRTRVEDESSPTF